MSEATGPGDQKPDRRPPSDEAGLSGRLQDLNRRLDKSRAEHVSRTPTAPPRRPGAGLALKLGADFVAGVVVGAAIGWGIDRLFGISPWGLIVFVLLGFAAGVLSVLRSAGLIAKRSEIDDPISRHFE